MKTPKVGTLVRWPSENWEGKVISVGPEGVRIHWTTKPNDADPSTGLFSKAAYKKDLQPL